MGKKYIVEIGRLERLYKAYTNGNGKPNLTWLSPEFDLTPYTEPDLEQIRKEAYEQGLSDAWECARKVTQIRKYGGYGDCLEEVFGRHRVSWDVFDYSATEAIEKIRQYEQEKEEQIQVGDEVELKCGVRPAIYMQGTKGSDEIYLLFNDGSCGVHGKSEIERKTGRHFPEIAAVLEKMRENT